MSNVLPVAARSEPALVRSSNGASPHWIASPVGSSHSRLASFRRRCSGSPARRRLRAGTSSPARSRSSRMNISFPWSLPRLPLTCRRFPSILSNPARHRARDPLFGVGAAVHDGGARDFCLSRRLADPRSVGDLLSCGDRAGARLAIAGPFDRAQIPIKSNSCLAHGETEQAVEGLLNSETRSSHLCLQQRDARTRSLRPRARTDPAMRRQEGRCVCADAYIDAAGTEFDSNLFNLFAMKTVERRCK